MTTKRLTEEERAERLERAHEHLRNGIATLTSSDAWLGYLQAMRKFHTYSAGNVMLILAQRPNATRVAGFNTWRSFGRHVKKGKGSGIAIFRPLTRKFDIEDETSGELTTVRSVAGYRIVYVYDIADTEGEDLPGTEVMPVLIDGQAPDGMWDYLASEVAAAGFALELSDEIAEHPEANGITDFASRIVTIATTQRSPASRCRTLAHELAHVCLHADRTTERTIAEVEAESVAFLVSDAFGLDGSSYTVPYVANWGATAPDAVLSTANRVMTTATSILAKLPSLAPSSKEVAA